MLIYPHNYVTFTGQYLDWNQKRIKGIVDFYGHQFIFNKKILDLGCGHADISGVLYRLGGQITAVDARQEHLKVAAKKFPGIKTVKADLDRSWAFYGQSFDLILDLDILCHLNNYEEHLKAVCNSTNFLVLETAVCDSNDPFKCEVLSENKNIYDLAVNGLSSRPSPTAIERILLDCGMSFKRQDLSKYNSGPYVYDWIAKNDNSTSYHKRRLWFASKSIQQTPTSFIETNPINPLPIHISNSYSLQDSKIPVTQSFILNNKPQIKTATSTVKLKTALCISGHLRTFESNFESVRSNILDKSDCDIFIHTWGSIGTPHRFDANLPNIETRLLLDKINKLYNPKKIVIEPMKTFFVTPLMQSRLADFRDVPGILSMFYKMEACNNLKIEYEREQGFTYDLVIRFRGDIFMETPLPLDSPNLNFLNIPMFGNFGGVCDQFAYGSSLVMNIYTSLYSQMERHLQAGAPLNPEKLLKFHIEANKIPINKVNVRYLIKRANGMVQDNMLFERALGFFR